MLVSLMVVLPLALAGARVVGVMRLATMMYMALRFMRAMCVAVLARLFGKNIAQYAAGGRAAKCRPGVPLG